MTAYVSRFWLPLLTLAKIPSSYTTLQYGMPVPVGCGNGQPKMNVHESSNLASAILTGAAWLFIASNLALAGGIIAIWFTSNSSLPYLISALGAAFSAICLQVAKRAMDTTHHLHS